MRLIRPKIKYLPQAPSIDGAYKMADKVAGICYNRKHLHKDSKKFIESLISRHHYTPLEFAVIHLKLPIKYYDYAVELDNPPLSYWTTKNGKDLGIYVTTNLRVLVENKLTDLLEYQVPFDIYHEPIYTFQIVCSRGTADELARHRTMNIMMRSTRYCKSDDLDIVEPAWLKKDYPDIRTDELNWFVEGSYDYDEIPRKSRRLYSWWESLTQCEAGYQEMLSDGFKPQEARGVLPLDMATELVLSGTWSYETMGWKNLLRLRTANSAHPDCQRIANGIQDFLNKGEFTEEWIEV